MFLGLYGEDRKLHRISIDDVTDFQFESDADNAEIAKALSRNYQAIKPQSTFVDLTLGTLEGATEDAEAIVQSVIPLSAWKMTYRIEAGGDRFRLEGLAIVDNNTDEDWANFLVSVVTGEPNTFATDLAIAKTPQRRTVNLVPESAIGGFQVAEGMAEESLGGTQAGRVGAPRAMKESPRGGGGGYGGGGGGGYGGGGDRSAMAAYAGEVSVMDPGLARVSAPAERVEADTSSVAEFQVFRSKTPVDIPAQSSALVPMFSRELGDARTILIYNEREMPRHPFRAVRLVNDTGLNLGRGSCAVFRQGVFSGQGILDHNKPGEVRLVPHSLELGVLVLKKSEPVAERLVKINVADGMVVEENAENLRTTYLLKNKLDEPFTVVFEYQQVLANSEMKTGGLDVAHREKIPGGIRFEFNLGPMVESTAVSIQESRLTIQLISLTEEALAAFGEQARFTDDPRVAEAMKLQESVGQKKRELARQQARRKAALEKQARVQQLVATARGGGGGASHQSNEWMKDLGQTEMTIRELDEKIIPTLNAELEGLYGKIGEALQSIRATWEDPAGPNV